jgi:hypothetical protein
MSVLCCWLLGGWVAAGGWLGGLVELLLLWLEVGGGLGAQLFGCKKMVCLFGDT